MPIELSIMKFLDIRKFRCKPVLLLPNSVYVIAPFAVLLDEVTEDAERPCLQPVELVVNMLPELMKIVAPELFLLFAFFFDHRVHAFSSLRCNMLARERST